MYSFDFSVIWKKIPNLLRGCWITLELSTVSLVLALLLGILLALGRDSRCKILSKAAQFYIWIMRGTPLIVQLYLIYFALPQIGLTLTAIQSGILGLALNTAAYIAEIVRSGIRAVDPSQREAARALGMGYTLEMVRIVGPQASRVCLLPLVNQFISTIKSSSLLSAITITDLTREGWLIANSTFRYLESYIAIAVLYLVLTTLLTTLAGFIERKMNQA